MKLFKALLEVVSEPTALILENTRGTSTPDWQSPPTACSRILSLHQAPAWSTLRFAVSLTRTPGKGEERRSHLKKELTCTWDLWMQGPSGVCWSRSTHGEQGQFSRTFYSLRRKGGDKLIHYSHRSWSIHSEISNSDSIYSIKISTHGSCVRTWCITSDT